MKPNREDFQEIFLTGGKITFATDELKGISAQYNTINPWNSRLYQLCVSLTGRILGIIPIAGIGEVAPYPKPSILVIMLSDRDGMFGRVCPKCDSYFRTSDCPGDRWCPYCFYSGNSPEFLTANQRLYAKHYIETILKAIKEGGSHSIDLDELQNALPDNRPGWLYSEEKQQNQYTCMRCSNSYDILGEYSICPCCGKTNAGIVYEKKIDALIGEFENIKAVEQDRHARERHWRRLFIDGISEFESFGNFVRKLLLTIPMVQNRKTRLASLNFQNIRGARSEIIEICGFDFLESFDAPDERYLNTSVNRRHILVHNSGRVDDEYLRKTDDTTVRVLQQVRIRSDDVSRLLRLLRLAGCRLLSGYESIA